MKFIDVCRVFTHKTEVNLSVFDDDMESAKDVGTYRVIDIMNGCWSKYYNYYVTVVKPVDETHIQVKVMKE